MTGWNWLLDNLYVLSGLFELLICLILVKKVAALGQHQKAGREFLGLLYTLAGSGAVTVISHLQPNPLHYQWIERFFATPFNVALPYMFLRLVAGLDEWAGWRSRRFQAALLLIPAFILFCNYFMPQWFWQEIIANRYGFTVVIAPFGFLYLAYCVPVCGFGLLLLMRSVANKPKERFSAFIILIGVTALILLLTAFNFILPHFDLHLPVLGNIGINLLSFALYISLSLNRTIFDVERALIDFERLKYFNQVSGALNADLSQEELLQLFTNNARKAVANRSVLYIEIRDNDTFRIANYSFEEGSAIQRILGEMQRRNLRVFDYHRIRDLPIDFVVRILQTGEPVIVSSLYELLGELIPRLTASSLQLVSGVRCYACLPVKVINRIQGIIIFSLLKKEDDLTLYHLFANQCGNILRHHDLLNSYKAAIDEQAVLLNNIAPLIWYLKDENTLGRVNRAFADFFQINPDALEGLPAEEVLERHPGLGKIISTSKAVFHDKKTVEYEEWLTAESGEEHLFHITETPKLMSDGAVASVVCIGTDITELRKIESQLRQSQKMDAIGQLAGGVAHNFNNLLSAIMGYADLIASESNEAKIVQFARRISKAGEHGSNLAQQLLAFARKGRYKAVIVNMQTLLSEVISLVQSTFDKKIRIEHHTDTPNPCTEGDPTQLMQMLLNLALNARDAMPGGGTLLFTSRESAIDDAFCQKYPFARTGRFLHITVSDTGTGISRENQAHIFEPFFTTKETGKGVGLGLSSVYGSVKNHNGFIIVDSEPGMGTRFDIYLPLAATAPAEDRLGQTDGRIQRASGHILLVEDEEDVRAITALMLERVGYSVSAFTNGRLAIDYYEKNHKHVDAVILDIAMPEMNGLDCMRGLKKIKADVAVIVASGHTLEGEPQVKSLMDEGARAFLQKPWKRADLLGIVESVVKKA
ncbi:MAG: response regulator [Fibrobacterota bacterium]